tara:strand:- start:31 stop:822 length:792 start_codon:yes stop_codon:yes gene_type:complete
LGKLLDALGNEHSPIDRSIKLRIVSLVPSLTELLIDLGLYEFIVGRTGFCIHPKNLVSNIPKIGGTKDVNIEKIRSLDPSHLIVNIDENREAIIKKISKFVPNIVVTHPIYPIDNIKLFNLMGNLFRVEKKSKELSNEFLKNLKKINDTKKKANQNIIYCIWKDPWMSISDDTYIANMLSLIGLNTFFKNNPKRYPEFSWEKLPLEKIDKILLSSEPYKFSSVESNYIKNQFNKDVLLVDGEMLSWYGSRSIRALKYLSNLKI